MTGAPAPCDLLASARQEGTPVHKVEEDLWDLFLEAGHQSMQAFCASHGTGDLGPTLLVPRIRPGRSEFDFVGRQASAEQASP